MMSKMKLTAVLLTLIMTFALAACGGGNNGREADGPTQTPAAVPTEAQTPTEIPTEAPTIAPTEIPADTPVPPDTPVTLPEPVPTEDPLPPPSAAGQQPPPTSAPDAPDSPDTTAAAPSPTPFMHAELSLYEYGYGITISNFIERVSGMAENDFFYFNEEREGFRGYMYGYLGARGSVYEDGLHWGGGYWDLNSNTNFGDTCIVSGSTTITKTFNDYSITLDYTPPTWSTGYLGVICKESLSHNITREDRIISYEIVYDEEIPRFYYQSNYEGIEYTGSYIVWTKEQKIHLNGPGAYLIVPLVWGPSGDEADMILVLN
ncbi:MAG: hypothetical protein FWE82_06110 [Defluviitaleaceae bacterium]|nr:hypothetical protein [Defluviitaleaceae bacterium]